MKSVYGIAWGNLGRRINELGGLGKLCGGDLSLYNRIYTVLNFGKNPTKKTIDWLIEKTGLTYEEAFEEVSYYERRVERTL